MAVELPVADYADFCVPAALASYLGVERRTAADLLTAHGGQAGGGRTHMAVLSAMTGLPLWHLEGFCKKREHGHRLRGRDHVVRYRGPCPTVAEWLSFHTDVEAIIAAGNKGKSHAYHVRDGEVIEDNRIRRLKAQVHTVCYLPRRGP